MAPGDPPPPETPGPSVTAPALPESDTERQEWADARVPDAEALETARDPDDVLVAQEESAAAAEAGVIGGPHPRAADDPRFEAAYESGEGEEEGWELAERDLIENATHGDGYGNPIRDALTPEVESDASTVDYGEPDEEPEPW
jgi:hypothetical protein